MNQGTRNYAIVTAAYWGFTLSDGALRMLVLLHFYRLGYSPFTLAFLFLLYEAAGIAANLGGGWLASRFGIPRMLAVGQALQIAGLVMLSLLQPQWSAAFSVIWVVMAQGIAGVAKDVTKLGLTRDHFPAKVRTEQRDHQDSDKKSGKEGTNLLHLFFIPQMGSSFARRHI